jgi:hypothetical protein
MSTLQKTETKEAERTMPTSSNPSDDVQIRQPETPSGSPSPPNQTAPKNNTTAIDRIFYVIMIYMALSFLRGLF